MNIGSRQRGELQIHCLLHNKGATSRPGRSSPEQAKGKEPLQRKLGRRPQERASSEAALSVRRQVSAIKSPINNPGEDKNPILHR